MCAHPCFEVTEFNETMQNVIGFDKISKSKMAATNSNNKSQNGFIINCNSRYTSLSLYR